ncbi:hypothetical protein FGO68_gene13533 [Halteria grandinella]|uniref:UBC core domain-containing protein n=1 Tax=Halteria grandinella TaxID=5974 RepID=A0A8J8NNC0_HALGN|nr:hypothetical protein FGO68_gene13533 [Halteria grandinella]
MGCTKSKSVQVSKTPQLKEKTLQQIKQYPVQAKRAAMLTVQISNPDANGPKLFETDEFWDKKEVQEVNVGVIGKNLTSQLKNGKCKAFCGALMPKDWPNDIHQWFGWIFGPLDSPYEGGTFLIDAIFPPNYPHSPPTFYFKTEILHPNIRKSDGKVFCEFFTINPPISKMLEGIFDLLQNPITDDGCLNEELANIYLADREAYNNMIFEHVWENAVFKDSPKMTPYQQKELKIKEKIEWYHQDIKAKIALDTIVLQQQAARANFFTKDSKYFCKIHNTELQRLVAPQDYAFQPYDGAFLCDICRQHNGQNTTPQGAFHCDPCQMDICFGCINEPQGHQ